MDVYSKLVEELISKSYEDEWFDFKVNQRDTPEPGRYIAALSNAAAVRATLEG